MAAPMRAICRHFLGGHCRDIPKICHVERPLRIQNLARCHTDRPFAGASVGIDIGLPATPRSGKIELRKRLAHLRNNKTNAELERSARQGTLQVPLEEVKGIWEQSSAPYHIQRIAHHYSIFRDLFDSAHFSPKVMLRVDYNVNDEETMPVYSGNFVTPTVASQPPSVSFDSPEDGLWTLLLTNPDGHLLDNNKEYIHWMIGNIPGNQLSLGDEIFNYMPPFPAQGTGYHRFVFVLFQQDGRVDYSNERVNLPCRSLQDRTFETVEFYRQHQDVITPTGLAFFQCRWDASVRATFHQTLDMREPIFEYDHPEQYIAEQTKWPHKKPLQYLFKYMPKDKRDKVKGFEAKFPDKRFEKWNLEDI